jgi:hypothetical protein
VVYDHDHYNAMDPASLTASILSIIVASVRTAFRLNSLHDRYRHAGAIIVAICAESEAIHCFLVQIYKLLSTEEVSTRLENAGLRNTLETTLLACTLVYSCLDQEVAKLKLGEMGQGGEQPRVGFRGRTRFLWSENIMRELMESFRAQRSAIMSLLQCLQV